MLAAISLQQTEWKLVTKHTHTHIHTKHWRGSSGLKLPSAGASARMLVCFVQIRFDPDCEQQRILQDTAGVQFTAARGGLSQTLHTSTDSCATASHLHTLKYMQRYSRLITCYNYVRENNTGQADEWCSEI